MQQLELRALLSIVPPQFVDPHPEPGNNFGASVTVLSTGNVVITASNDDAGGGSAASFTGAGAVYLYDGRTGALISKLTGSQAGDQIGSLNVAVNSGVFALTNGNFVIDSPAWNGSMGAATWGSGTTGVSGSISAVNSLVGSSQTDSVGSGQITVLRNGNYVVDSYNWNHKLGAVTWGNGTTGVNGIVSAANSLVGSLPSDQVGGTGGGGANGVSAVASITQLSNSNYVVASPNWGNNLGAVTWGSGTTGVRGIVSAANSLAGSSTNDQVGSNGVTALSNGNYVVDSANWSNGLNLRAGAVTLANGASGTIGPVNATNSLVGSTGNDQVGDKGVTALSSGNYVVDSPDWNSGALTRVGAVTYGNGTTGVTGTVSQTNSLVGSAKDDQVGAYSVTALKNGNYVVDSFAWNSNLGAVTWGNGQTGVTGIVDATNSLIGSLAGDKVGSNGVTPLNNGNYVIASPDWSIALAQNVGAVTWGDGMTGATGIISANNSLVGSKSNDSVGFNNVTALSNGNYVVVSSVWGNQVGAVTWGSGTTGITGVVGANNSLTGSQTGDILGERGVTSLRNGNYVVASPSWSNGSVPKVGAMTWGSGTTGVTGKVDQLNSLIGASANDQVGDGGIPITVLSNGNYVVASPNWSNGLATNAGAETWADGTTGVAGIVDVTNSLVGASANDQVGSGSVTTLNNGNYIVANSAWNNGLGAVTFGNGATGLSGVVSTTNSIVGQIQFSGVSVVPDNAHGAVYAAFNSGTSSSSVYRGSTATGFLSQTTNGPSIIVSNYTTAVSNGSGSVSFGNITLDPSVPQTIATQIITVTNNGDDPLVVQPVTATSVFSIVDNFSVNQSILPGASVSFTVQLNATAAGTPSGTVTILSNDATANSSFSFNVTGTVAVPVIDIQEGVTTLALGSATVRQGSTLVRTSAITVPTVSFGSTLVGTPVPKVITVTNSGHAALFVTSVTVPTGFSVTHDFVTNHSIAPGGSARFTLQLNATAVATFVAVSNVVTIVNNDPHSTQITFNVSGTVTAPKVVVQQGTTTLSSGVSTINLGITPAGTPVTRVIKVTNSGNAPLIVQPVIVPTGFAIVGANFHVNQSIPAGGNASFTLQLTAASAGNPTDVVTIPTSDTLASQFTFGVTGIVTPVVGVGAPVAVMVVQQGTMFLANGRSQDFFAVGSRVAQVITVSNYGNAALVMGIVTVPVGFTLQNDTTSNQSIAAGHSASFMIQLNASVTNTPMGNVTIRYHDPISKTFTFSVVADHAPTAIRLSSNLVSINPTGATFVGVLTTTDPDSSFVPQIFTYLIGRTSLNFVPTNSSFSIDSGGDLYLSSTTPQAMVGPYDVSITSTDQGGSSVNPPQTIRIFVGGPSVAGVESALSTTLTSGIPQGSTLLTFLSSLNELQFIDGQGSQRTMVVRAAAVPGSDTDLPNPVTYQLGVGGDNSDFTIDQNGNLQTVVTLNSTIKPVEHISIISTNTLTGISATHPLTVTVLPAPQRSVVVTPPATPLTVPEASANGFAVGTVTATDIGGQNLTYTIAGGNINGAFAIDSATGLITVANSAALDLASSPTFVLTLKASDTGVSGSAAITISLTGITLSNSSVAENAPIGAVIGQFNTKAAQTGNTFQYSLIPGKDNDAYFTIDASGHLMVKLALNVASKNFYTIDVVSVDQNGSAITKTFTITVLRLSGVPSQFVDPHLELGNQFGSAITALSNGNVVITAPNDDAGGGNTAAGTGAGAVYLFNGQTGLLISTFKGSQAGDHLGSSGVTALNNGNFVIDSPNWHNGLGAVTWGSGTAIVNATIGSTNSLVGSTAGDAVGLGGVTALPTGNYVVDSSSWNHVATKVGAVTFGNGTTGIAGSVNSVNSLVGTLANDQIGLGGVTVLSNGNYVVDSSAWNKGAVIAVGAVTWASGTTGIAGTISATNSLIGSTAGDAVGLRGVTALSNGNYVVNSSSWNHGAAKVGAVTFGNATGISGIVSVTNSLVGNSANDQVGLGGIAALNNGNYVVDSYSWRGSLGAVTWGSGATGLRGTVNQANSLVGTKANDRVGGGGVTALTNGNYVVDSYTWNNGAAASAGAVTLGNGTTGVTGTIVPTNSLVGSMTNDYVGRSGVTALTNGNYVVASKYWHNGSLANAGAVTWGDGVLGVIGAVSFSNSLVGSSVNDNVGIGGVTSLSNGNYVVDSYLWNGPGATIAGAVTWGRGTTGVTGTVSSGNSLVGTQANDYVGLAGVTALSNGNYVVDSKYWNNGAAGAMNAGAVTWGNGTQGIKGSITQANSLVGTKAGDFVGFGGSAIIGITALTNGNYLVSSSVWNNGAVVQVGAVTFGNGRTGTAGVINNQNSVLGQFSTPLNKVNFVRVTPDNVHGTVYAELLPPTGLSQVYRGSTSTGFTNTTTGGASIKVSNEVGAIANGSGTVSFGTVTIATPVAQTIRITNNGNAPLVVQPVTVPAGYSIVLGTNFTLNQTIAPGASASFTLQIDATATGSVSGIVAIQNSVNTFKFTVNAVVAAPLIVVRQGATALVNGSSAINFGSTQVGTPVSKVITVTNNGTTALLVSAITVPAGFSVVNDFATNHLIAVGASTSFTLQLNATSPDALSGVVTIASNAANVSAFQLSVTGSVTAPSIVVQQGATTLSSLGSFVSFGTTSVGTPVARVITVTNNGNSALTVQSVTVPTGFSIVAGKFTANQSIAVGTSVSFTLQLDAQTSANPTGLVTITCSDPLTPTFLFNVTGIVQSGAMPVMVVKQGSGTLTNGVSTILFNNVTTGVAASQVITITNGGTAPLVVSSVTTTAGFSVINNNVVTQPIPIGGSAVFTIQLNANVSGTPTGQLTINSTDPSAQSFKLLLAVNHRPSGVTLVFSGNTGSVVTMNQTSAVLVGAVTTTDPDSTAVPLVPQTFSYAVASPTFVNGAIAIPVFSVDSHGNLYLAAGAPVGSYSLSVTSTDQDGLSVSQSLPPIYVTGPGIPSIAAAVNVANNSPAHSTIANLPSPVVVVQDAAGVTAPTKQVFNLNTYRLGVGGDNNFFTIDATGNLQTAVKLDASVKSSYLITIISTDTTTGLSTIRSYAIQVVPVLKNSIVVTPNTFTLPMASANGTAVGTVAATDVGGQSPKFSIAGGNVGGAFTINPATGGITVANSASLQTSVNPTFNLIVQVIDIGAGASGSATIAIRLT